MTLRGAGDRPSAVIFDLGGVLIDWNPRYLYRQLIEDEEQLGEFLGAVCTLEWNARLDAGRPWSEAVDELVQLHPHHEALISAYHERWAEMLGGPIADTVDVLAELREEPVALYALTNWSAEKFPIARERFDFLRWFDGIVVSGEERLCKPDPAIFQLVLDRFSLKPAETVFVDDAPDNVEAAAALGMRAIRFTDAAELRRELTGQGLLNGRVSDQ